MSLRVQSNAVNGIGWMYWAALLMVHGPIVYLFGSHFYILELGPLVGTLYWPSETASGFQCP
jgi:hypothetical protein